MKRYPLGRWERRRYAASQPDVPCRCLSDPAAVDGCPWIELAGGSGPVELRHATRPLVHRLRPRGRLRVDSLEPLADSVACGYGILPSWLAECPRHGMGGSLSRVLADWLGAPVELSLHVPQGPRSRPIRVLMDYLLAHLPRRWALSAAS